MSDISSPSSLLRESGARARKSLGQNFILDMNLARKIARASGALKGAGFLEIGPGPGGLTRALLEEGAEHVVAVEKDARFLGALSDMKARYENLSPVIADALSFPLEPFLAEERRLGRAPRIASNLAFNIATPLLTRWLSAETRPDSVTVLLQSEVARRITAEHGGKDYGRLSILCQSLAETRLLFAVPKDAFTPRPKVDAQLTRLEPHAESMTPEEVAALSKITAAAFSQRRKKLRAGLKRLTPRAERWIAAAGLRADDRPEDIPVSGFQELARIFKDFTSI